MKFLIAGGSGQVGMMLARDLHSSGHDVTVLSRHSPTREGGLANPWRMLQWDGCTLGPWVDHVDGADVVINLAGRSVNCRYSAANRQAIMDSRVDSTRVIGKAISHCAHPPRVWLQASTATIYAHRYDAANDEATGILGGAEKDAPSSWKFSIDVATSWERVANETPTPRTRKVLLRSAVIMSPDRGGIFDTLLGLVRAGLGGTSGDGRQYVSWIHDADFIRAVRWLIEQDELEGSINLASPNPLPNRQFMRELRTAWGARVGLPASRWMLEIGALFLRTETELVLKSRRVVPGRLLESGFQFEFPTWPDAAVDLCARWRRRRSGETLAPAVAG